MIDYIKPTPAIPSVMHDLARRIEGVIAAAATYDSAGGSDDGLTEGMGGIDLGSSTANTPSFNQLTINEYLPGTGIGKHIGKYSIIESL